MDRIDPHYRIGFGTLSKPDKSKKPVKRPSRIDQADTKPRKRADES